MKRLMYRIREVAEMTGIPLKTLRDMCLTGKITGTMIGNRWYIRDEVLQTLLKGDRQPAKAWRR